MCCIQQRCIAHTAAGVLSLGDWQLLLGNGGMLTQAVGQSGARDANQG